MVVFIKKIENSLFHIYKKKMQCLIKNVDHVPNKCIYCCFFKNLTYKTTDITEMRF